MTDVESAGPAKPISVKLGKKLLDAIADLEMSPSTALRRGVWAVHEIKRAEAAGGRVHTGSSDEKEYLSLDESHPPPVGQSPIARSLQLDKKSKSVLNEIASDPEHPLGKKIGKSGRVRAILNIYLQLSIPAKAGLPWFVEYGNRREELRIPGFRYHQPLRSPRRRWIREFESPDGKHLLKSYAEIGGFQWIGEPSDERVSDDTLFVAQTIMVAWYNNSRLVQDFIETRPFARVVSKICKVRRTVFRDDQEARVAYDLLQKNSEVLSTDGFVHLNRYFGKNTLDTLRALEEQDGGSTDVSLMTRLLRCAQPLMNDGVLDPRSLVKLWRYESLDCRAAYWVKRLAKRDYDGELSPLVNMAFRLLARAPDNLGNRQRAFERLNSIDREGRANHAGRNQLSDPSPASLDERIDYLSKTDDWGWKENRPWIFSLDQQVRHVLLETKLNSLLTDRALKFSYAAYSVSDGVPVVAWSDGDPSVERCALARVLVNRAVSERQCENEDERNRLSRRGILVKIPQKNGYLLVAHTLKRVYALLIWVRDDNSEPALKAMEEFQRIGISYEFLSRERLGAKIGHGLLDKMEKAYESRRIGRVAS